jgi:serine/threonine protein kinase
MPGPAVPLSFAAGAHPSPEQLSAFALGHLTPAELDALEPHVAECAACCQILRELPNDPLIQLLRSCDANVGGSPAAATGPARELDGHPRYQVLALLGAGGMGAVYKARHLLMDRLVALKLIHRRLLEKPEAVERFRREVRAAARLAHPNIVTAHDADQAGGSHFLVMEFIEGVSLARLVSERGPLPVAQACEYVRQAALGLQHAFEHGMVHRDVKPQNLMLTPQGQVKILDFGLAHVGAESGPPAANVASETRVDLRPAALTHASTMMGTPDYMAPEQSTDPCSVDIRTDIYALGCTLYYLLVGQPPFPEGTTAVKLASHRERAPQSLTQLRKDVPSELARVVERMLAKSPAERYQTPQEVVQALFPFIGVRPAATRRRRWWLAVAAGVLLTASALILPHVLPERPQDNDKPHDPSKTIVMEQKNGTPPKVRRANAVERLEGHTNHVWTVEFSRDGQRVLTSSQDGTVRLWDLATGKEVRRFPGNKNYSNAAALSPDGRWVLASCGDRNVRLWDAATDKELHCLEHPDWVEALAFSPDGTRALTGCRDHLVRLWDLETGEQVHCFEGHTGNVRGVAVSPDGRRALSASWDHTVILWDLEQKRQLRRFKGHTGGVHTVCFSPDGKQAISGGWDPLMRLWDLETGAEVRRYAHQEGVHSVSISPDGRRALSGGDGCVRLWDLATGKELRCFRDHTSHVWSVAISPDGRRGISGSQDSTVRLWDLPPP